MNGTDNLTSLKGSEWRRWDLHVHTPASALHHSFGDNWNVYIDRLIDAIQTNNVSVIATADYFTISGYRELLKYYNVNTKVLSFNDKNVQVLIIPGIELRLNLFNSDDESINLHVMFDPEACCADFIDEHFLQELTIKYRGGQYGLKNQAILAIGKSIERGTGLDVGEDFSTAHENEKRGYLHKALGTVTLNPTSIQEALKEIDNIFKKQHIASQAYLVAIVGKGHGGIRSLKWFEDNKGQAIFSRAGLIREDLTYSADIIFSNDRNDREFYLGRHSQTPAEEVRGRFKRLKPCVWGSDAHDYDNLLHPSNGQTTDYTWIKSDVSFEGLRQIVFEPDLRVRIQNENPNESETFARIDTCEISLPENLMIKDKESTEAIPFCMHGSYNVEFSNNLTCIIGGRGSGKSTLVHILYNSWANRESGRLVEINSPLTNLQLSTKDPLSKVREFVKVDIPNNTEFFLQNEIEKFARDVQHMSELPPKNWTIV